MTESRFDSTEKEPKVLYFVRTSDDGTHVPTPRTNIDDHLDIWQPNVSQANPVSRKIKMGNESLKIPDKLAIGTVIKTGDNYFEVEEPRHTHLAKKWGGNSVFVKRISGPEYLAATSKYTIEN